MRPVLLFAPGAGAPSSSAWMQAWAARLETVADVERFDYAYMKAGSRRPDRLPALIAAHREALAAARAHHGRARPFVLAGKSMGSRVGCHLAAESAGADAPAALVCFGYPLRSASSGALRDDVLKAIATPVLFVQGDKDPLCPLDQLEAVRGVMKAPSALHVVAGGDHSLVVGARDRARTGRTPASVADGALAAVAAFLAGLGLAGPA